MAEILVLDNSTIDKIAAGEVIERPASIVKELVENAVDAGATALTVEIKEGGISFIRITDNGSGIPASQIKKAFMRHATSKIRSVEDLFHITSLGFRGEALSSIAAVSSVECITKTSESLTGIRYLLEGAKEVGYEEVGAPDGTTIIVRNLFFNTPARKKFLKSTAAEGSYIADLCEHLALSHPDISFKFVNNGQVKFHTSGNGELREIIYRIYGREIASELIAFQSETKGLSMEGFIGKPSINRANRNYENYFVNGRYIKSELIAKAMEEGYREYMMQHKFPFLVLHFQIDTETIDVNVHPNKMDIRFHKQEFIYDFLVSSVKSHLKVREMIPDMELEKPASRNTSNEPKIQIPEPFEKNRMEQNRTEQISSENNMRDENSTEVTKPNPLSDAPQNLTNYPKEAYGTEKNTVAETVVYDGFSTKTQEVLQDYYPHKVLGMKNGQEVLENAKNHANIIKANDAIIVEKPVQLNIFDDKMLTKDAKEEYLLLGQIFDTYWIISYRDRLLFVDQHAAHEKVIYESLIQNIKEHTLTKQLMNPPIIINLTSKEEAILWEYQSYLEELGFEMETFGTNSVALRSVPMDLFGLNEKQMFEELIDELAEGVIKGTPLMIEEKLASMACKAAVKGGHTMNELEMRALLDSMLLLDNPYHCPHGRPTMIAMSKYELEKKFKRIL